MTFFGAFIIIYKGQYELVEWIAPFSNPCGSEFGWVSIQGISINGDSCVFHRLNNWQGDWRALQECQDHYDPLSRDIARHILHEPYLCCDVDMTPDDDPVVVQPGGRFGLTGYAGNPTADPIVTDICGGVKYNLDYS